VPRSRVRGGRGVPRRSRLQSGDAGDGHEAPRTGERSSAHAKDAPHRQRKRFPRLCFLVQVFSTSRCDRVDPRPPIVLRGRHLGGHLPAHLKTVKSRVERTLARFQAVLRHLLQPVGNAPAVVRAELQDAQNQQIQSALQELRSIHGLVLSSFERSLDRRPLEGQEEDRRARIRCASSAPISRMKMFRQRISPPCVCSEIGPRGGTGCLRS